MGSELTAVDVPVEQFVKNVAANPRLDLAVVQKALDFATRAHATQKRVSGEPYVTHPVAVANILIHLGMDTSSICAGLLHDVLEDTPTSVEELIAAFGAPTAALVQGVTKISKLNFASKAEAQAENLRKMLLAMTEDVRVIIVKLADRLHNLCTLKHLPPAKQQRIAQETLDIFAPLAHRLGISKVQFELEDLCLKYLNPTQYFELVHKVEDKRQEREAFLADLITQMTDALKAAGIDARVRGRPKSFYSIFKKTLKHDKSLSEIYDLIGLRVITRSLGACYEALGVVHETWKPLPGRFKDYIAVPKTNLYQSLHTTLIHPAGKVFEVQIRTEEMDRIAETGIAAHWAYKDGPDSKKDIKENVQDKLTWLRQILDWHQEVADSAEFVNGVKLDLFQNQVYVFTPNGKVVELPAGATPIDFAYAIHTEVGHACVGAHVNGKLVPLTYELKNGQIAHVITNKNSKGPSRDWLDVVKSTSARAKIKQWLKRENKEEYQVRGRELVLDEIKKLLRGSTDPNLTHNSVLKSEEFKSAVVQAGYLDTNSFYVAVGHGEVNLQTFSKTLNILPTTTEPEAPRKAPAPLPSSSGSGSKGVLVAGMGDMLVRLSKCCNPVVGDPIVGYITRGRGVSVHRADCPNIEMLESEKDRQVGVSWDPASVQGRDTRFLVEVEARVMDRPNTLLRVTNVISNFKLNIHSASARVTRTGEGILNFSVEITSTGQLSNLLEGIRGLPEVISVYRVQPRAKARAQG